MLKSINQDNAWRNFAFSSSIILGELVALSGCSTPAPPNVNISNVERLHLHEDLFELGLNMEITSGGQSL